jgi:p-aminobenzoyl-glutamate transporter AbgT
MENTSPNLSLAAVTFVAGITISDNVRFSLAVSVVLFILGKLIDLFVKPRLEERRARKKALHAARGRGRGGR